jgi:hypothetical protein
MLATTTMLEARMARIQACVSSLGPIERAYLREALVTTKTVFANLVDGRRLQVSVPKDATVGAIIEALALAAEIDVHSIELFEGKQTVVAPSPPSHLYPRTHTRTGGPCVIPTLTPPPTQGGNESQLPREFAGLRHGCTVFVLLKKTGVGWMKESSATAKKFAIGEENARLITYKGSGWSHIGTDRLCSPFSVRVEDAQANSNFVIGFTTKQRLRDGGSMGGYTITVSPSRCVRLRWAARCAGCCWWPVALFGHAGRHEPRH